MARQNRRAVRLYARNGYDFGDRFPKIIEAIKTLLVRSCFIDGEVIVVDERGLSVFDRIRSGRRDRDAVLCAFDLIEFDGKDLRSEPIEARKQMLANLPFRECDGISVNHHFDGDGAIIFNQACALGCILANY